MAPDTHWRANNFESLLVEEWKDGFTVFQPDSGQTHFLNPAVMGVLHKLHAARDETLAENLIRAYLADEFPETYGPSRVAAVEATLDQLNELGLIEKCLPERSSDN